MRVRPHSFMGRRMRFESLKTVVLTRASVDALGRYVASRFAATMMQHAHWQNGSAQDAQNAN
jgi:hypothetical protein